MRLLCWQFYKTWKVPESKLMEVILMCIVVIMSEDEDIEIQFN